LVLEAPPHDTRLDNTLRARRRRALREGCEIHQEGDVEAILLFDAADQKKARLALRLVKARKVKKVAKPTPAQLCARAEFAAAHARTKRPRQSLEATISPEVGVGVV
jgi:hypothetical protein